MPDSQFLLGGALLSALTMYVIFGGADFGGGVWDLFASGERAAQQRATIAHALAPVWEANHVWLVIVIVILFTGFPRGFAAIATALHVPLTLALVGIVLRGASFVFRAYGSQDDHAERSWGRVFAIASLLTPLLLGMIVGALTEGHIRVLDGRVETGLMGPWLTPFAILVGAFALALFAFLAAVYLTVEASGPELADDFRHRALGAALLVGMLAWAVFVAARGTPMVRAALTRSPWAIPWHAATAACAVATFAFLFTRTYAWARWTAAAQVLFILWGWALSQFPFLIRPDITLYSAAAPLATRRLLLSLLATGAIVLVPTLIYLYSVFGPRQAAPTATDNH
jgi:cytochrome bd ubiquinol oxidase subunit II